MKKVNEIFKYYNYTSWETITIFYYKLSTPADSYTDFVFASKLKPLYIRPFTRLYKRNLAVL